MDAATCTCLGDLVDREDGTFVFVILLPDQKCIHESHRLAYALLKKRAEDGV